jgi:hypothetical protein
MTLEDVAKRKPESCAEQAAAEELVRRARQQGLLLTGPDGLLRQHPRGPSHGNAPHLNRQLGRDARLLRRGGELAVW